MTCVSDGNSTTTPARALGTVLALALVLPLAACGNGGAGGAGGDGDAPGVHFVRPADGATVTSPVEVVFGAEDVEVAAVPEEADVPRQGTIHFHLGVDTECLPPGTPIPQSDPWTHFGDGSDRVEVELEPGEHQLIVQAGDDHHVTLEGMCEMISITVEEGGA